jgi:nucleotide-binding universal stress UspA family protein
MSNILVPLDGSFKDERAIPAATSFADLARADLRLIRVFDTPVDSLSSRAGTLGVKDAAIELKGDIERSVRGIADRIIADTGFAVTAEVAEGFDVAGVLISRAAEPGISLVVMGTEAAGALGRVLRGSVADRVMRESPRPVVLVPPGTDDINRRDTKLRRVLVPLDGSDFALSAVNQLLKLPGHGALEYVLLEVVTSGFPAGAPPGLAGLADTTAPEALSRLPDIAQERAAAEARLANVAEILRSQGATNVHVRVVEATDPAAAISRATRDEKVDFIAMSTRGSSGLKRLVLGSVAEKVVRDSVVPVLLVTPR